MKTNIYYFSATGNSLVVAKDIAAGLPETKIFSIPQAINESIDLEADNIGIVFPVYFCGIPRIVSDFIKRLDPSKVNYLFAVCTFGGLYGGALIETQKQLEAAGIGLNAGYAIQLPGNYIVKYGAYSRDKQGKMFSGEKKKVELIVNNIKNQRNSKAEQNNFIINRIGKSIYQSKLPQFPTLDKNFTVDDTCNGCGICERVCPVQNIYMEADKPQWQGNCEHCVACIQWCPKEAIQYSTQTADRKRYHHPDVRAKDLFREPEEQSK